MVAYGLSSQNVYISILDRDGVSSTYVTIRVFLVLCSDLLSDGVWFVSTCPVSTGPVTYCNGHCHTFIKKFGEINFSGNTSSQTVYIYSTYYNSIIYTIVTGSLNICNTNCYILG